VSSGIFRKSVSRAARNAALLSERRKTMTFVSLRHSNFNICPTTRSSRRHEAHEWRSTFMSLSTRPSYICV
jgi:hypothetical protein